MRIFKMTSDTATVTVFDTAGPALLRSAEPIADNHCKILGIIAHRFDKTTSYLDVSHVEDVIFATISSTGFTKKFGFNDELIY